MSTSTTLETTLAQHEQKDLSKSYFGFWVYLMTDCILFASLFATYAVLRSNTNGGPGPDLFDLPYILIETILLLISSFTCGLAVLAARNKQTTQVIIWLVTTFIFGAAFVSMEVWEFSNLIKEGETWARSGFLSAYFTLVGTHGLHILAGLLWIIVLTAQIARVGLTSPSLKRLTLFSLFWHFLDIVWIFIFTIVYLMGAVQL